MRNLFELLPIWLIRLIPPKIVRKQLKRRDLQTQSVKTKPEKTIFVDISTIHNFDSKTGIQRVVRSILSQLIAAPPDGFKITPVYATKKRRYAEIYAENNENYFGGYAPGKEYSEIAPECGDIFLALDLCANIIPHRERELIRWKSRGVKLYILVYDILPLTNPEWFTSKSNTNFKKWIRTIAQYSDGIICISKTVRRNVEKYLEQRYFLSALEVNASAISLGSDLTSSLPTKGDPANLDLISHLLKNKKFILVVGTLEPRKGHADILNAFNLLWSGPNEIPLLVILGKAGWKTENLQSEIRQHKLLNKQIIWIEDASDEFLTKLYQECLGVLIGSYAEGYGLPLVEANLFNARILARDLPVFRELELNNITYYKSSMPLEFSKAILDWIENADINSIVMPTTTWETSKKQLLKSIGIFD